MIPRMSGRWMKRAQWRQQALIVKMKQNNKKLVKLVIFLYPTKYSRSTDTLLQRRPRVRCD